MQRMIRILITTAILISILIHLSEQSFLWNILNRSRALFAEESNPSSRILSNNLQETEYQDDNNYEKATHRETDSSERFRSNAYDRKRTPEFPQNSPQRPFASETQPHMYKENGGYYGKYAYSQERYPNSLHFYSFLGGLSFASLLATTLIVLSRRNGSLFRTFEDDDLYRRSYKTWEDIIPTTFIKLIDHPADHLWNEGENEKRTNKKKI